MKSIVSFLVSIVLVITLPLSALAWPTSLHDDGGPYRDLAVAASGPLVAAAVLNPTTIELTILNSDGEIKTWASFELPEDIWQLPRQQISVQLYPGFRNEYELIVSLVTGDDSQITYAALFSARIIVQGNAVLITPQSQPQSLVIPQGSCDMQVLVQPTVIYVIWRTTTEDNINSVLINRYNRSAPSITRVMMSEF